MIALKLGAMLIKLLLTVLFRLVVLGLLIGVGLFLVMAKMAHQRVPLDAKGWSLRF